MAKKFTKHLDSHVEMFGKTEFRQKNCDRKPNTTLRWIYPASSLQLKRASFSLNLNEIWSSHTPHGLLISANLLHVGRNRPDLKEVSPGRSCPWSKLPAAGQMWSELSGQRKYRLLCRDSYRPERKNQRRRVTGSHRTCLSCCAPTSSMFSSPELISTHQLFYS